MRSNCSSKYMAPYMISQVIAAILAGLTVNYFKGGSVVAPGSPDVARALLNEFLFTFALCYVALNVARSSKNAGNSYYGLAIGFTVMARAFAGGGLPARAFKL